MTTLITGATGFIGRHLVAELTTQGQPVLALMRRPDRLQELRARVDGLGGNGTLLTAVAGDLDLPDLGLQADLPGLHAVVHLGAAFVWGLGRQAARLTNVTGALAVAQLARRCRARLVMISGFMLENQEHMQRLGISPEPTIRTGPTGMNTLPESLHFLQTMRFDTRATEDFLEAQGLAWAPIGDSIRASAAYFAGAPLLG